MAEALRQFADALEGAANFDDALHALIKEQIIAHKRIIFNGNGYDDAWIKEATEIRGLKNYRTTPDCMPHLLDEKNVTMLTSHGVFTRAELDSRCEIMLENYCKSVVIEANTMLSMARTQILPAVERYSAALAESIAAKRCVDPTIRCASESERLHALCALADDISAKTKELDAGVAMVGRAADVIAEGYEIRDILLARMEDLRASCDEAETLTAKDYWPYPSYADLLFATK